MFQSCKINHQRGNILFLILLAVGLFAVLSYAVTSANRGEGKSASGESASAMAAQVLQYLALVENTVTRMRLTEGVKDYQLSFQTSVFRRWTSSISTFNVVNTNCTSSACLVYKSAGGTVPEITFETFTSDGGLPNSSTHPYPGHAIVSRTKVSGVGTPLEDLIIFIRGFSKEVCDAMNVQLGVNASASSYDAGWGSWGVGPYTPPNSVYWSFDDPVAPGSTIGSSSSVVYGRNAACIRMNTYGYTVYYVLVAR